MLQKCLILAMVLAPLTLSAQKNADPGGVVTFEKSEKSLISYSGWGLEYYRPTDLYSQGFEPLSQNGFGVSYELFNPFRPKTAVTFNSAFKYMMINYDADSKYNQTSVELNLGLHQLIVKGFYVKPQIGLASVNGNYNLQGQKFELEQMFKGTYALQSGYLFKLGGERSKFLDVGVMYQSYFTEGSYLGLAVKYLLGPKSN